MNPIIHLLRKRVMAATNPEEGIRPLSGNYEVLEFIDTAMDFIGSLNRNFTIFPNQLKSATSIDQMVVDFAEGFGWDAGDVPRTPGDLYVAEYVAHELAEKAAAFMDEYFAQDDCRFMYHYSNGGWGHYALENDYHLLVGATGDPKEWMIPQLIDALDRYPQHSVLSIEGDVIFKDGSYVFPIYMTAADREEGFKDISTIMTTIGFNNILIHINTDEQG